MLCILRDDVTVICQQCNCFNLSTALGAHCLFFCRHIFALHIKVEWLLWLQSVRNGDAIKDHSCLVILFLIIVKLWRFSHVCKANDKRYCCYHKSCIESKSPAFVDKLVRNTNQDDYYVLSHHYKGYSCLLLSLWEIFQ